MKYLKSILFSVAFIIAIVLDKSIAGLVASNRMLFLDKFFAFVINYMSAAILISLVFIYIVIKDKKSIKPYLIALASSVSISVLLKIITNRTRPFIALALEKMPGIGYDFASWNLSFPSWHAVSFFFMIPFISRKYKPYWFALAVVVGFSRIYSNVHYLSDVLFGALLGYIISKLCISYR